MEPVELEPHHPLDLALALSLASGRPFRARRVELGSEQRTWLRAARAIGSADVGGEAPGDRVLRFSPGPVRPGDYLFEAGAGSVARLFQMLCFPLALAGGRSTLKLRGTTHPEQGPSVHVLSLAWVPVVAELGWPLGLNLERAGFPPEGGGELTAQVSPASAARPFRCTARGTLREARALTVTGGLPPSRGVELGARAVRRLREKGVLAEPETLPFRAARGAGLALHLWARFEHTSCCFYQLAAPGSPGQSADRAAEALGAHLAAGGALETGLGAQLVLPLALAAAGRQGEPVAGRYTARVSKRLLSAAQLVPRFLDVRVAVRGAVDEVGEVVVAPEPRLA